MLVDRGIGARVTRRPVRQSSLVAVGLGFDLEMGILRAVREAGVMAAPVPSKHAVGVRIPCLALTTDFRLPPYKGAIAVAVRAHDIALCDFVEDSAI